MRWLALLVLFSGGVAGAAPALTGADPTPRERDTFLRGELTYFIEHDLGWTRGSYQLRVNGGVATITLPEREAERRTVLQARMPRLEQLKGVNIVVAPKIPAAAQEESSFYSFLGLARGSMPFPVGDLFVPLLADPKQPQFFTSYRYYSTPINGTHAVAVGYGETFGFYRIDGRRPGDGLQVSLAGALFAQFNLDTPSQDLINADYTIGVPITWRNGSTSARVRIYHQSSHLGDEYLLRAQPNRVNLSFESLEVLVSEQRQVWRVYFGGEYLFHRDPAELKPAALHGGVEFRTRHDVWETGHWVGGLDVKSWQEHDWNPDVSLKVGLEFGAHQPGERRVRLMLEGYRGYDPHGQFYQDFISYYGLGLYLGF